MSDVDQELEWRVRILDQMWRCRDQETFCDLGLSALSEAKQEGLDTAAALSEDLANVWVEWGHHEAVLKPLQLAISAIRELAALNRQTDASGDRGGK